VIEIAVTRALAPFSAELQACIAAVHATPLPRVWTHDGGAAAAASAAVDTAAGASAVAVTSPGSGDGGGAADGAAVGTSPPLVAAVSTLLTHLVDSVRLAPARADEIGGDIGRALGRVLTSELASPFPVPFATGGLATVFRRLEEACVDGHRGIGESADVISSYPLRHGLC
jgi:hypothetical protein